MDTLGGKSRSTTTAVTSALRTPSQSRCPATVGLVCVHFASTLRSPTFLMDRPPRGVLGCFSDREYSAVYGLV
jgi:hypothetical protein